MVLQFFAAVLVELVLRVLEQNGVKAHKQIVKATVSKLIASGESIQSIPGKVVQLLGCGTFN